MTKPNESKLAVLGGQRAIPEEMKFLIWPEINAQDEQFVLDSLRQNNHAFGPNCVALQNEFAQWNGNKFCAATNSGTAALHMALAACGISSGDEVITTTLSWTSSATCILHHNAIPIFVDIEWDTMLIDPSKIEAAITPKTKAILPVHYWGVPCDMDAIMDIASKHGLHVIEDACQSPGSLYKGKKTGHFGRLAAFSLNQNKNFCGGEGGLLVTDDEDLYTKAQAVMNFGETRAPEGNRDFHSYGMGWMYRTSDLPAAFARSQLLRLDATNTQSIENYSRLKAGLDGIEHLVQPFSTPDQQTNAYAYVIRINPEYADKRSVSLPKLRDGIVAALSAEGVPVAASRMMLPTHTIFQAKNGYGNGCPWSCPFARKDVSYDLAQYPIGIRCTESAIQLAINAFRPPNGTEQIDAIISGVRKVFGNLDKVPV